MTAALLEQVLATLAERRQRLATAESLTGGLLGELITGVPGASVAYVGGVISYATSLKATLAGVATSTLDRYGAVAAVTAGEMADGVRRRCRVEWGLATTGVAGPGEQDGHPVGQVFVAVAGPDQRQVRELRLTGSRPEIRQQTAERAVLLLAEVLGMAASPPGVD